VNEQNIFKLKHNNIFNNVKLLHVSVTSNLQADISVNVHDMSCIVMSAWWWLLTTETISNFTL